MKILSASLDFFEIPENTNHAKQINTTLAVPPRTSAGNLEDRTDSAPSRIPISTQLQPSKSPAQAIWCRVQIRTDSQWLGIGYARLSSALQKETIQAIAENEFFPLLIDQQIGYPEFQFQQCQQKIGKENWSSIFANTYAAIDLALWDLKAKERQLPLYKLFGPEKMALPAFVSGTASASQEVASILPEFRYWQKQGAIGLLIEVGSNNLEAEAEKLQVLRDTIGEETWLGVSANNSLDWNGALALAPFLDEDLGADWFEEPLRLANAQEDRPLGYQKLAERVAIPLASGTNWTKPIDFLLAAQHGAIRVLRPDIFQLGGLTPLYQMLSLVEPFPVTVVPRYLPEIAAALAYRFPAISMVDYSVNGLTSLVDEHFSSSLPLTWRANKIHLGDSLGIGWDSLSLSLHRSSTVDS